MGVILGSKAQSEVWADSAKWLATRSGNQTKRRRTTTSGAKAVTQ
jgi:hypothetical protein